MTVGETNTLTFDEIFKSKFLEEFTLNYSVGDVLLALGLSFLLGLFIFFIYRKTFQGVMLSKSFGISLIAMCMITTLVILAVTSNVVLSLGMVGALSIVRFRTAVKESMDIAYLFWAIAVGIVTGAGMLLLAVVGSVVIGVMLLAFSKNKQMQQPYIAVIQCQNEDTEERSMDVLGASVKRYVVKGKTVTADNIELTVEVRLEKGTAFVNEISRLSGVKSVALVSYNGDYQ